MYIFSWLKKYPVISVAIYFGILILVLISMTGNDSSEAKLVAKVGESTTVDKTDTSEVSKLADDPLKTVEKEIISAKTMAEDLEVTDAQSAQFNEMSTEELLLMAREAYWNNGLDESEEIYLKLIELSPDVIDYKGELGNVHWRKGEPKKAAARYAEIAFPMIKAGENVRVANMVGFIGFHYPEIAAKIHDALKASK